MDSQIPPGFQASHGAWIHRGARLAADVVVEPGAIIGDQVEIGAGSLVGAHAVIRGPTTIGQRNRIFPGAILGEAPQDQGYAGEPTRLEIGDDNIFREQVTVHRGSTRGDGVTRIGHRNFFMVGSHVAHDCHLEDDITLANNVLIAGHCHIASKVNISGAAAVAQFTTVGRHAFVGGMAGTASDVEPFLLHDGLPATAKGVNVIGCRRAGFPPETLRALKFAYRKIYLPRTGVSDFDRLRQEIEAEGHLVPEVIELLEFIQRSRKGKFGRQLQGPAEPGPAEDDAPTA